MLEQESLIRARILPWAPQNLKCFTLIKFVAMAIFIPSLSMFEMWVSVSALGGPRVRLSATVSHEFQRWMWGT